MLLAAIQIAISKVVIYPGFINIEEDFAVKNLNRAKDALTRELYHLEILTKDWAYWTDTYEFIEDLSPKYIESCLNDDTFVTNNIQAIYYLDTQGKIVWHRICELPDEQAQSTHQVISGLFDQLYSEEIVKGLISTDVGPLLLVSCGIYDSERSKPCRGRMIMARFLDEDAVNELIQQTHVKFEIQPLDAGLNDTTGDVPLDPAACSIETGKSELVVTSVYEDLHGQPTWLIRAIQDREITSAGKRVVFSSLLATTVMLVVLAVLLLYGLHRFVVMPITSLTTQINHLRKSKKLDQSVRVRHGHETRALAEQFNRLMRRVNWDEKKRRRAEKCMTESVQKEQQANRAKSEFLANMSHELRTPMNSILGFTELMMEENLTTEQRDYLKVVHQNGQSLLRLINDVLDMSKIESGNMQLELIVCSPAEIAHELRELMQPLAAQKKLDYKVITSPNLPETIVADPLRLKQVLINLVGNAVKFTREGRVHLNMYRCELQEQQYICFAVEDTGIGIPADKQKSVFESFRQADSSTTRKYGGSGLGLTIAKQLSELMGGMLHLQSEPDIGSVFTLRIPITPETQSDTDVSREVSAQDVFCGPQGQ
jgi:signal transduction histidine kinase